MMAREVDERDARTEEQALGFRVVILGERGVHWHSFDLESDTLTSVEQWALEQSAGSEFSIAARVAAEGGVSLIWLTPPPESFYDDIRT